MRILHTESSCGWGGQEIRILDEAQGISARGHDVAILAPREARIYEAALERGLRAEAVPIARKNMGGLLAMRRWLQAHPVDVVNSHSSTDSWLAALACATLAPAPALVRTRHISASIPNNLPTRWLYRSATRHIVTTGENLRMQLIRDNRIARERITSVPTGIDSARFVPGARDAARRSTGLPSEGRLIGIVATLRSWKGHRYLIEALRGLPGDVGLVIVGDGPPRDPGTLMELLQQSGFDLALVPGDNRYSWLALALGAKWIVAFSGDRRQSGKRGRPSTRAGKGAR